MKSKYSAEEKFQIVMESLTGNVTRAEICRRHGIYPVQLSKWRDQFMLGGKAALAQRKNNGNRLPKPVCGYWRIWAILRNQGTKVNQKAVRKVLKDSDRSFLASKHRGETKSRSLYKPTKPVQLWETDITYIPTESGMTYLMCVKDCFTKEWQGFHYSRSCMARDAVRSVENAVLIAFNGSALAGLVLKTDNGPQYSAPRNIHDLPMEVWFRKVWGHPNSYGHGYVCEGMAEAARMQNRRPHQRRTHISTVRPHLGEPSRLYAAKAILRFTHPQKCSLPGVMAVACGESHVS